MKQALLVSSNRQIISEFESIAALANVNLIVTEQPTNQQIMTVGRIFVDHESPLTNLDALVDLDRGEHSAEMSLVLSGAATAQSWKIAAAISAQHIVLIPESRSWLVEYIKSIPSKKGQVISFTSVVGGAGSTTIALAFARTCAQRGSSVTLIDLDFQSVGLEIAAGAEKSPGLTWSQLQNSAAQADGEALASALPEISGVKILANDLLGENPSAELQKQVINRLRESSDFVIIDGGPWCANSVVTEIKQMENFLIVPNTIRACAVAREIFARQSEVDPRLIVREIPGSGLNPVTVAQTLERPLAATVPTDSRVCELSEQGLALSANPLSKFNRPITTLSQQIIGEENVLRVA